MVQLENRIKCTVIEYRRIENQNLGRLERELEALQAEIEVIEVCFMNFLATKFIKYNFRERFSLKQKK